VQELQAEHGPCIAGLESRDLEIGKLNGNICSMLETHQASFVFDVALDLLSWVGLGLGASVQVSRHWPRASSSSSSSCRCCCCCWWLLLLLLKEPYITYARAPYHP